MWHPESLLWYVYCSWISWCLNFHVPYQLSQSCRSPQHSNTQKNRPIHNKPHTKFDQISVRTCKYRKRTRKWGKMLMYVQRSAANSHLKKMPQSTYLGIYRSSPSVYLSTLYMAIYLNRGHSSVTNILHWWPSKSSHSGFDCRLRQGEEPFFRFSGPTLVQTQQRLSPCHVHRTHQDHWRLQRYHVHLSRREGLMAEGMAI